MVNDYNWFQSHHITCCTKKTHILQDLNNQHLKGCSRLTVILGISQSHFLDLLSIILHYNIILYFIIYTYIILYQPNSESQKIYTLRVKEKDNFISCWQVAKEYFVQKNSRSKCLVATIERFMHDDGNAATWKKFYLHSGNIKQQWQFLAANTIAAE